ncbi:MAG: type II toxin-antitoxin system VapC family toxin [Caulobacteraceae bacterium]
MIGHGILLDTCAALWLANDELDGKSEALITDSGEQGLAFVSPISAWEIGLLVSRGRLALSRSPEDWFDELMASKLSLAPMPPKILIQSSALPGTPPRDPADRIIAATARAFGYRVITRDRELFAYGDAGHLEVVPC